MNTYFKGITKLEELKKAYHKLAMVNHPDMGGDVEKMKAINNAYEEAFNDIKNHCIQDDNKKKHANQETASEFKDIIDKIIQFNVNVEIIGNWIWLSGETKAIKDRIKEAGFRWGSQKKMWYWHPEGYVKFGKKKYDINEIRGMYGNQVIKEAEQLRQI